MWCPVTRWKSVPPILTGRLFHKNREMGLILRGREVAQLRMQFDQDWRLASGGGDAATHPEHGRRFTDRVKDWWRRHE
jgi:phosphatidylserine/phosphatidylglycerophosphate/cardiolipin synthase-like enzyme